MQSFSASDIVNSELYNDNETKPITPFRFDPNTIDEEGFYRLGLRPKLVQTIIHYRNKGGRFRSKEDLQKIWGLRPQEYQQLEPYVSITQNKQNHEGEVVELNSADTSALIALSGIGSKLAFLIIQYREKLGGYVSVNQLREVYGMSDENFRRIKPQVTVNAHHIRPLNLNAATFYELNAHPYLHGEIAIALADFRRSQHYKLQDVRQIREIGLINEEIFRKIAPYLTLQ
jgi:competence ComEA-like helix-hairpin-helix protein